MRTFQCLRTLQGDSRGTAPIAFSSDNQTLVSGGGHDATIRVGMFRQERVQWSYVHLDLMRV